MLRLIFSLLILAHVASAAEAQHEVKALEHEATQGDAKYSGSWWEGFLSSWSMILVSEIGDKTFFIACLMAMRNDRLVIFCGAISALTAMTILSAALGYIVPTLLPPKYTQLAAVVLFTGFGLRLMNEARTMDEDDGEPEEMLEAQAELAKKEEDYSGDIENPHPVVTIQKKKEAFFGPIFAQAFGMTFLAEWGDRSQIATIALAAAKNPYGVTLGGIVGHSICTGSAVMIGKKVATTFSQRSITWFGGILFVFFGLLTAYQLSV